MPLATSVIKYQLFYSIQNARVKGAIKTRSRLTDELSDAENKLLLKLGMKILAMSESDPCFTVWKS
jgi:hypothetical protein